MYKRSTHCVVINVLLSVPVYDMYKQIGLLFYSKRTSITILNI